MEKLVVKTAVKTVLIILGALIAVFAVFNFAFPQHMATVTESIGNYSLAIKYASLRYYYTGEGQDLARCFDDAILLGEDTYILKYGEELVGRKDFEAICVRKNEETGGGYDYRQRVLGKIAVSYYNTGKKTEAVDLAAEANGTTSFAYGNALMSLSAIVRAAKDAQTCSLIIGKIEEVQPVADVEKGYKTEVLNSLRTVINTAAGTE